MHAIRVAVAAVVGLGVIVAAPAASVAEGAGDLRVQSNSARPNVIIIVTDDQRHGTEVGMPTLMSEVAANGVRFTRAMVPTSWCCPSRASLFTGNFAHTTGVWENTTKVPYGAWPAFKATGAESDTLATRLDAAGYRTGLFGKYLNGMTEAPPLYRPPGWDVFDALLAESHFRYRFTSEVAPPQGRRAYLTDEIAQRAVEFIRSTPADLPLLAFVAPYAPHTPLEAGRYHGSASRAGVMPAVRQATRWPSPAVNQRNMGGYPAWMQSLRPSATFVKSDGVSLVTALRRQQDMLLGVDAGIERILDALALSGRLGNSLIVFTSDNGYLMGEHRLQRKHTPYDASIRVPLVMRFDGRLPAGKIDDDLAVANVDLYATILDIVGVEPASVDGRSLLSDERREGMVVEAARWRVIGRPAYCGWREPDFLFVRYSTGEEEAYDYVTDPYELRNVAEDPAYAERVASAREKARGACDPVPPDFTWGP